MIISVRVAESGVCVCLSYAVCSVACLCNCFVVRGCSVLRRDINVCSSDVFSVVNMCHDHLKFSMLCVLVVEGMSWEFLLSG